MGDAAEQPWYMMDNELNLLAPLVGSREKTKYISKTSTTPLSMRYLIIGCIP